MVVLSEDDGGVRILTFNRPERLNAWTAEMGRCYFDLLEEADRDPSVRAIVVTGAGKGFCSGADFADLTAIRSGDYADEQDPRPITFPTTLRTPVVAAVNGACAGLGMVHALVCDVVVTADDATWMTAFSRRGLIAEYGLGWILPRLAGQAKAMDLLLSGRVFTGAEACAMGLAARAVPGDRLLVEAVSYAKELSTQCSPASMAVIKGQIWGGWQAGLDEARDEAVRLMMESFRRPDFAEGVASFLERRDPRFPPLT
ncbi:enoyl-CoA hydratase-related protein [Microbispora triticiradicis]|uniref:Enoyl-CoA hydratase n=2 Tax=Microbispora TaxID=2005 RepID=A0ABY3M0N3_9ACTN|nr:MULTISPECIES: enoyl-CoA hydratase-related protein [Microbispora]TLP58681.1 enoyl-CoA hydratase [Microbispora fusca]TYB61620.1 enoyl-CoA hydratase [Microbispora tritici]